MNDDQSLQASFWLMVLLQTMGSVDMPGRGERKMPAPRAYLATIVIWSILQVAADAGYGRAAKASAWLVVLAGLVFGPFGTKLVNLFTGVVDAATGSDQSTQSSSAATVPAPTTRTGQPVRPGVGGIAQVPYIGGAIGQ